MSFFSKKIFADKTKKILLYIAILGFGFFLSASKVYAATLTMSTTLQANTTDYVLLSSSGTTPAVSGFSSDVVVNISVTNGTVKLTTTTGLSAPTGYNAGDWSGATQIVFEGSQDDVNNALATLAFQGDGSGSTTLQAYATPTGAAYSPDNGHYYIYADDFNKSWDSAQTVAANSTFNGLTGYLATITSQAENDFVKDKVVAGANANVFLGASDADNEGVWIWETGPEVGTQFWSGGAAGSAVNGEYSSWANNEPGVGTEDYAEFYNTGLWNDVGGGANDWTTYIIEYGGFEGETASTESSADITITNLQNTNPTLESFTPADNASDVAVNANLILTFNEAVNTESGADNDIVIKLTADDTVVETIDAQDSTKVSGDGTTTITINPASDLTESTEYYIQIGADAFDDNFSNSYAGISDTTSWSFTTASSSSDPIVVNTPADTSTSSSSNTTSNFSAASPSFCSDFAPAGVPEIFQIDVSNDSAKIYFTPILGVNTYYISFSDQNTNAEQHGVISELGSIGVQNFTISSLKKDTKYFFKVRGQNGCMPGDWSNVTTAATSLVVSEELLDFKKEVADVQNENENDSRPEKNENQITYQLNILIQEKEQPKPHTKVLIPELNTEVITNEQGEATIDNVSQGKYTFKLIDQAQAAEEIVDVQGDDPDFDILINLQVNKPLLPTSIWIGILGTAVLSVWLLLKIKFAVQR